MAAVRIRYWFIKVTVKRFVLHAIQPDQIMLCINRIRSNSRAIGRIKGKLQTAKYNSQHHSASVS